jgi:hypothetical protein
MLAFPYILTALLLIIVRTDHNHKIFIRNSLQLVRSSLKSYSCGKFGLKRFFLCCAIENILRNQTNIFSNGTKKQLCFDANIFMGLRFDFCSSRSFMRKTINIIC